MVYIDTESMSALYIINFVAREKEREDSDDKLPIETMVILVGKSDQTLNLRTDIVFASSGGININKIH